MKDIRNFINKIRSFKSSEDATWLSKFNQIYQYFLSIKNKNKIDKYQLPYVDIKDETSFNVALSIRPHIGFRIKDNQYEVIDFDELDLYDLKSDKGVYKISKEQYEECLKKTQEMSQWLDEYDEKTYDKSDSVVGTELNLNIDEYDIAIDELNDKLNNRIFKNFTGKSYEFELSYHLWSTESTNELKNERYKLPLDGITIHRGGDRFYGIIQTKDIFNNKAEMWVEADTNPNYYDFEKEKYPYDSKMYIRMNPVKEMSRKQERESLKKYPSVISYLVTPSKYDSIELIKTVTEVLSQLNEHIPE